MTKKYTKPQKIETSELCKYGCGSIANYKLKSGGFICSESSNSCETNKKLNSVGGKIAYSSNKRISAVERYKNLPQSKKNNMNHKKDKRYANFEYNGKGQHKLALIDERGHMCECCKNTSWMNKPITIELDHIDGDNKNNKKENLKLLCPNCHSQTTTWRRAKNPGKIVKKHTDEDMIKAIESSENLNQALVKLDLRWGSASTLVKIMNDYKVNFKGH